MNLCRSCKTEFGSVTAFDAHRVGSHSHKWSVDNEDGRRCLDVTEMEDKGFRLNRRGAWSLSDLTGTRSERLTVSRSRPPRAKAA